MCTVDGEGDAVNRWAWAEVSSDAIRHNTRALVELVDAAQVWAVVKADGYGHGVLTAAHAALAGGARGLCVALVQEGLALRRGGIDAPILVLSEQPADAVAAAVAAGLELTVYTRTGLDSLIAAGARRHPVHVKVDTGMRRVGASAEDALSLAEAASDASATRLAGFFTHLAVADAPDDPFTDQQLDAFDATVAALRGRGVDPGLVHAANSAGAIAHPRARYDMVRAGIAIYGVSPGDAVDAQVHALGLRPAMAVKARVSYVKRVAAGERISYGLRHTFTRDATVATLPIGYADGVPRRLHEVGGAILLGGVRRPIVGVVTMDQTMVDCGDAPVEAGDEAVLIGEQGAGAITATEWADALGTIGYEIVCGISSRIERRPA